MQLPEPRQFGIRVLAERWKITEEGVREYIRAGYFKELMITLGSHSGTIVEHYFINAAILPTPTASMSTSSWPFAKPSVVTYKGRYWQKYIHSMAEFPWPSEESTLSIPLKEVEAFEREYVIGANPERISVKPTESDGHAFPKTAPLSNQKSWILIAREIGVKLAKKYKNQSLEQIAEKVRHEMEEIKQTGDLQVTGRGGKIVSSASIKRHALKGLR